MIYPTIPMQTRAFFVRWRFLHGIATSYMFFFLQPSHWGEEFTICIFYQYPLNEPVLCANFYWNSNIENSNIEIRILNFEYWNSNIMENIWPWRGEGGGVGRCGPYKNVQFDTSISFLCWGSVCNFINIRAWLKMSRLSVGGGSYPMKKKYKKTWAKKKPFFVTPK